MSSAEVRGKLTSRLVPEVEWKFPDFFRSETVKESPPFAFENNPNQDFCLRIIPKNRRPNAFGGDGYVSVFLVRLKSAPPTTVNCVFGVKSSSGRLQHIVSLTHVFTDADNVCGDEYFLDRSKLLHSRSELAPSNVLVIKCLLPFCVVSPNLEDRILRNNMKGTQLLSDHLKDLFDSGNCCDLTLKVNDKEFQVHSSILAARSTVFAAILQHDMLEKQTRVIKIDDCDPEAFDHFLYHLYTGKVKDIPFDSAFELYKVADKYDVKQYKSYCVDVLKNGLCASNICKVLNFAELYDDSKLLSTGQEFFNNNMGDIFNTSEWQDFLNEKPSMANKFLLNMSSKIDCRKKRKTN